MLVKLEARAPNRVNKKDMMAKLLAKIEPPKPAPVLARALAFLFGDSKPHAAADQSGLEVGFIAALTGSEIVQCDSRSMVIAAHNSSIKVGETLLDRLHVVERPIFLLALSQAASTKHTLIVRLQDDVSRHFVETQVSIQKSGDSVFVALMRIETPSSDELARELAHELRTPLAAMVGLADALSHPQTCTDDMREAYPALIASAGRNLIEMTGCILGDGILAANAKLGVVAQDCIALLQPMAKQKSIVVFNRLSASLVHHNVDGAVLRQIITNLISNAIKYSPNGASVELSASKAPNGWTLNITDNGNGIAPEDVARLGQKNFRGQSTAGIPGHGLGLSIVRRLVDEASGRICFESRPGKGTRVEITFPASTLVEMSDFQSQAVNAPVSTPIFNIAAGAKHAAA